MQQLAEGLWESLQDIKVFGIRLPRRMTVVRLRDGGLWLHSVNELTPERKRALDGLGEVKEIVAPNCFHHFFLEQYAAAYPGATMWAPPGLPQKRKDVKFDESLARDGPKAWPLELDYFLAEGAPAMGEFVFFHVPTKTVIQTDTLFNIVPDPSMPLYSKLYFKLTGAYGHLGPSWLFKLMVKDKAGLRRTVDKILAWDFERVLMGHGGVVDANAKERFRAAYAGYC